MALVLKQRSILPGFGLTMGYTLLYLSLIVLIPLAALFFRTSSLGWERFWFTITDARAVASYKLTFGASLIGALVNAFFGFIVAWTLVRYRFPGKRLIDALVDLPFALPTAVSGIALTAIFANSGWLGGLGTTLEQSLNLPEGRLSFLNFDYAYTRTGVAIALTFIGLPFVVRTLQPALADLDAEIEEAAESLGASPWQTFRKVIFPTVLPALLTGFTLAFARAVGEYGSVVFIAGNMPMETEITSLLIIQKLEQYQYAQATAIAVVMLVVSFAVLLAINLIQWWASHRIRNGA